MGLLNWLGIGKPRDAPAAPAKTDISTMPSIPDNPDIRNDVRDSGTLFVFGKANSGEMVDERSAMQIATVYACVRLLAESVAQLPLHLYKASDNNVQEKAVEHPLYKILYREPNPEMTSFSFWEVVMTHLLLWGNSYSQIVRDGKNAVLGIYPLLPENVEIDRTDKGELYYIYHAYTNEVPGETNKDITFRRDEIMHIPGLSFNGLVGFSPVAMMKNSLGTTMAVEKYGSAFFKNGAQPAGVLEHPGVLKDPQKIRDNWAKVYGGANNAHRVALLEEGMTYKPISLPPEDSQFLSTREFGVEEICRIFRVPPHMVQDLKRATFSNIEHQSIDFVVHTLDPWLVRIEKAIVKDLLLENEKDEYFPKFNVDGLLRGDYKSRMDGYSIGISTGITSPNEARRKENMQPLSKEEGGDFHIVNGTFIKLKDVGQQYGVTENGIKESSSKESSADEQSENTEIQPEQEKEEHENKRHTERHEERKKARR